MNYQHPLIKGWRGTRLQTWIIINKYIIKSEVSKQQYEVSKQQYEVSKQRYEVSTYQRLAQNRYQATNMNHHRRNRTSCFIIVHSRWNNNQNLSILLYIQGETNYHYHCIWNNLKPFQIIVHSRWKTSNKLLSKVFLDDLYLKSSSFQKTWDWVILGLTFYTVIIVPANLAINK